jgi:hypothetical protein
MIRRCCIKEFIKIKSGNILDKAFLAGSGVQSTEMTKAQNPRKISGFTSFYFQGSFTIERSPFPAKRALLSEG